MNFALARFRRRASSIRSRYVVSAIALAVLAVGCIDAGHAKNDKPSSSATSTLDEANPLVGTAPLDRQELIGNAPPPVPPVKPVVQVAPVPPPAPVVPPPVAVRPAPAPVVAPAQPAAPLASPFGSELDARFEQVAGDLVIAEVGLGGVHADRPAYGRSVLYPGGDCCLEFGHFLVGTDDRCL